MRAPVRIQRKRTKGWRMPEGAVYVGRGSRWGNPLSANATYIKDARDPFNDRFDPSRMVGHPVGAAFAVEWFREYATWQRLRDSRWLPGLRNATALACWCPLDQPCHADVLIELLEAPR